MKFCFLIQGFWLIDMPIVSLTCQNRPCISKLISELKLYDPISVKLQFDNNLILTIITEKVTIKRVMQIYNIMCFVFLVFVYGSFSSQMRKCICQNNTSVLLSKFNNQLLKCTQTEKAVAICNIKHAQYKLNMWPCMETIMHYANIRTSWF